MKVKKLKNARLFFGDNLVFFKKYAKENSVDLTVTSPPYDNLKNYQNTIISWTFKDFKAVANSLFRITKQGGTVVWVTNDATIDGSETGNSFRQALYFKKIGFRLHDTMIFAKYTVMPGDNPRQLPAFEYMFVLCKGKINTFHPRLRKNKNLSNRTRNFTNMHTPEWEKKTYKKSRKKKKYKMDINIWGYNTSLTKETYGHPATFPLELALDHILTWSNEGDIVFDPFMGSGTTGRAAIITNRRFIGVERIPDFFVLSERNITIEIKKPVLFRTLENNYKYTGV